jgi:excisionase family DNA binding protein
MKGIVANVVDFGVMLERLNQIPEMIEELKRLRGSMDAAQSRREYMGYEEAAGYLRLGVTTLQQLVCAKRVPYYKVGARVLFIQHELDDWVAERKVEALSKRLDKRQKGG